MRDGLFNFGVYARATFLSPNEAAWRLRVKLTKAPYANNRQGQRRLTSGCGPCGRSVSGDTHPRHLSCARWALSSPAFSFSIFPHWQRPHFAAPTCLSSFNYGVFFSKQIGAELRTPMKYALGLAKCVLLIFGVEAARSCANSSEVMFSF